MLSIGTLTSGFHRAAVIEPLRITQHSLLPQASVGKEYAFQFISSGAREKLEWKLFSAVPAVSPSTGSWDWKEWKLEPGGRLTGKPTGVGCDRYGSGCPKGWTCGSKRRCEGVVTFNVIASDESGRFDQRMFDLLVTDPANPIEVGSFPTLTPAAAGQRYDAQLYVRGGTAPFTWRTSKGSLPPGLALERGGLLTGTPSAPGSYKWTVEVSDSESRKATKNLELRVDDISKPIVFTPNPEVIIRPVTPRIGFNVSDETTSWNDVKLNNQYNENPGLEPHPPFRQMYWAWAGSANTLEEWNYAQYREVKELNTGFWDGGRYWILSGPAKGRTGRIAKYERVPDKAVAGGYRAVWTLSDSDPSRLVERRVDPKDLEKNIFMVEAPPRNDTESAGRKGTFPPGWVALGDDGTIFSVETDRPATGRQSGKVVSNNDVKAGLGAVIIWENAWRRLRKDTTYRFSVDVRQSGAKDGKVIVQMVPTFFHTGPSFFAQSFDVPDDGRFHHIAGQFTGNDESNAAFQVLIQKKGTLWVDNALLYESSSIRTSANGARQDSVSGRVFEPLPFILDDLRRSKAGCLRFNYHGTGLALQDALTASTESAPGPLRNLFSELRLAETLRTNAWITTPKEWTAAEFVELGEYLSSTDTTKGLGKHRAEQGHPMPWTDTIGHIYIEYANEAWNWPGFAYPFDPWHPAKYASFAKERFEALKASPYRSPKVSLVLNGQVGDDFWVNDPVDKLSYPSHDAMDIAPYIDVFLSTPLNELSATVLDQELGFTKSALATMKIWSSRGETTKLLVYEGGPNTSSHLPSAGEEARKNSMTLASLHLDSVADLFANGVDEYNVFIYQNIAAWQVTTGASSRFRLPIWYATKMFNEACATGAQVETKAPSGAPMVKAIAHDKDGKRIDGEVVPAISVRSYLKNGRKSFLLINRNPLVEYPLMLQTQDKDVSYRVTKLSASRADRGTLEGLGLLPSDSSQRDLKKIVEGVQPASEEVKSADGGVAVALPPASIVTVQATAASDE